MCHYSGFETLFKQAAICSGVGFFILVGLSPESPFQTQKMPQSLFSLPPFCFLWHPLQQHLEILFVVVVKKGQSTEKWCSI